MSKIYKSQTLLTIELATGIDISAATVKKIIYQKPDGTEGSWDAVVVNSTNLFYDIATSNIDQAGAWKMQAFVTIAGKDGYGDTVTIIFKDKFQ